MELTEEQLQRIVTTAVREVLTEERKFWLFLLQNLLPDQEEIDWEEMSQEAYQARNQDWFEGRSEYSEDLTIP